MAKEKVRNQSDNLIPKHKKMRNKGPMTSNLSMQHGIGKIAMKKKL
jgi:hypothetical protein